MEDGIVVGTMTNEQLEGTHEAFEEGPLEKEMVECVEEFWWKLEGMEEAPYSRYLSQPERCRVRS